MERNLHISGSDTHHGNRIVDGLRASEFLTREERAALEFQIHRLWNHGDATERGRLMETKHEEAPL